MSPGEAAGTKNSGRAMLQWRLSGGGKVAKGCMRKAGQAGGRKGVEERKDDE